VQTIVERPPALDVHKAQVTACARVPDRRGRREQDVAEFPTTVRGLQALRDWLGGHAVTQVVMEATGVYRRLKPRRGHKRALGAVKHTMICAIWHMLSTGETYRDLGGNYFHQPQPRTPNPTPRRPARTPRTPRDAHRGGRGSPSELFLSGSSDSEHQGSIQSSACESWTISLFDTGGTAAASSAGGRAGGCRSLTRRCRVRGGL